MTEHTSGPWSYRRLPDDNPDPNRVYLVDAKGSPIADIFNTGESPINNAALIAAAPDLLAALHVLVAHALEQYPHYKSPRGQEEIQLALAAIEKTKPRLVTK